jgi:hypothetical protein
MKTFAAAWNRKAESGIRSDGYRKADYHQANYRPGTTRLICPSRLLRLRRRPRHASRL